MTVELSDHNLQSKSNKKKEECCKIWSKKQYVCVWQAPFSAIFHFQEASQDQLKMTCQSWYRSEFVQCSASSHQQATSAPVETRPNPHDINITTVRKENIANTQAYTHTY